MFKIFHFFCDNLNHLALLIFLSLPGKNNRCFKVTFQVAVWYVVFLTNFRFKIIKKGQRLMSKSKFDILFFE